MRSETMEYTFDNKCLTLFLEGELNSYNAEDIEKEIDGILEKNDVSKVVLDLAKLDYLSSAGIRIIIRLKQRYADTSLVRVQDSIYEIFEMVGLPELLKIERLDS